VPQYELDSSRSRFTVQAFASGMLWAFAHNPTIAIKEFTGGLTFSPQTPEKPTLDIVVNAHSLESTDPIRPKEKQEIQDTMMEALDVSTYPTVRYRSTEAVATRISENWFRMQFKGHLSLRGVTKPQEVDAQLTVLESEIRLNGAFTVLQSNFKIHRPSAAAGLLITKDELKFAFDVFGAEGETIGNAP
jgi:polyisoprenoid-binding protein YceI